MEVHIPVVRSLVWSLIFFAFTPVTLALSFTLLSLKSPDPAPIENPVRIFASIPDEYPSFAVEPETADARVALIKNYLTRYKSPLAAHAQKLVDEADKNHLDFRLLTAIARQESNMCRYSPEGTYNCWGWGIHKRGTLGFQSFDEAIEVVSLGLAREYINKGLKTPEEIMTKYTPSSNGSWAFGVSSFMEEIQ